MNCDHPVGKLVENRSLIHRKKVRIPTKKLSTIYAHVTQWLCTGSKDNLLIIK